MDRWVEIVHVLPGRVRLRVVALRARREEAAAAARALAALPGVMEVRVRPFTGSFLVTWDPVRGDGAALARALADAVAARGILAPGERPPVPPAGAPVPASRVGRALVKVFREANEDLLRRTDGGLDLGVVATAAFLGLGAAEVVASKRLAAPPWFNLAWWGLQTFIAAESPDSADGDTGGPSAEP
jgi:hypothetical protein